MASRRASFRATTALRPQVSAKALRPLTPALAASAPVSARLRARSSPLTCFCMRSACFSPRPITTCWSNMALASAICDLVPSSRRRRTVSPSASGCAMAVTPVRFSSSLMAAPFLPMTNAKALMENSTSSLTFSSGSATPPATNTCGGMTVTHSAAGLLDAVPSCPGAVAAIAGAAGAARGADAGAATPPAPGSAVNGGGVAEGPTGEAQRKSIFPRSFQMYMQPCSGFQQCICCVAPLYLK
mmetsp:Transcript_88644/g.280511  ORF Transcript_88644/g.280511 Transcript_88644/m.280511 type:complete len:242 (-) Transcript_88644:271-996(-)